MVASSGQFHPEPHNVLVMEPPRHKGHKEREYPQMPRILFSLLFFVSFVSWWFRSLSEGAQARCIVMFRNVAMPPSSGPICWRIVR
jgi:hypothetical protein